MEKEFDSDEFIQASDVYTQAVDYFLDTFMNIASYSELYSFFKKDNNHEKWGKGPFYFNYNIAWSFALITNTQIITEDDVKSAMNPKNPNCRTALAKLTNPYRISASVKERELKRRKDIEENLRHKEGFTISKKSYQWAIAGIIAGGVLSLIQIELSVYDIYWGKDYTYEKQLWHKIKE